MTIFAMFTLLTGLSATGMFVALSLIVNGRTTNKRA